MSSLLPLVDLTGAVVGTKKTLDFNQFVKFNPANQQKAHLGLFNESACGLQCVMQASGDSQYLPAGGWTVFEIESNDSSMQATVTYILPNPPVSQLNGVYYAPGEETPQSYTLGNSPIGIGGSVSTNSNTLSNEGGPANVLIEDIGDAAFAQLYTVYSDGHALWYVDQAGVRHQVMKVATAGNPLQLGQAGDITETLGQFQVDDTLLPKTTVRNSGVQVTSLDWGNGANILINGSSTGPDLIFESNSAFQMYAANQLLLNMFFNTVKLGIAGGTSTVLGNLTVNQDVTFLGNILPNQGSVVHLVGGAAGTADLYAIMTGTVKVYMILLNGFKTGASNQSIALPTAFTTGAAWIVTDSPGYNIVSSGVNQTVNFMTTTQNSTSTTTGQSWNLASLIHAWDTITWPFNNSTTHSGFFFIVGV